MYFPRLKRNYGLQIGMVAEAPDGCFDGEDYRHGPFSQGVLSQRQTLISNADEDRATKLDEEMRKCVLSSHVAKGAGAGGVLGKAAMTQCGVDTYLPYEAWWGGLVAKQRWEMGEEEYAGHQNRLEFENGIFQRY